MARKEKEERTDRNCPRSLVSYGCRVPCSTVLRGHMCRHVCLADTWGWGMRTSFLQLHHLETLSPRKPKEIRLLKEEVCVSLSNENTGDLVGRLDAAC